MAVSLKCLLHFLPELFHLLQTGPIWAWASDKHSGKKQSSILEFKSLLQSSVVASRTVYSEYALSSNPLSSLVSVSSVALRWKQGMECSRTTVAVEI